MGQLIMVDHHPNFSLTRDEFIRFQSVLGGRSGAEKSPFAGFTLLELLIATAVLSVLLILLLPVLQAARETARQTSCSSNLKQLALAVHMYHDTYHQFPQGVMYAHPSGEKDHFGLRGTGWSWSSMVLPFLDQAALYHQISFELPPVDPSTTALAQQANQKVVATPLSIALCPSDTAPLTEPTTAANTTAIWAVASYSGNGGSFSGSIDGIVPRKANGLFFEARSGSFIGIRSSRRFRDIFDGNSQTVMLAESAWRKSLTQDAPSSGVSGRKRWYACMSPEHPHAGEATRALSIGRWRMNPTDADGVSAKRSSASSEHPQFVHMAMADGSVRRVSESIHHTSRAWIPSDPYDKNNDGKGYGVYQRLWSINDGLNIGEF